MDFRDVHPVIPRDSTPLSTTQFSSIWLHDIRLILTGPITTLFKKSASDRPRRIRYAIPLALGRQVQEPPLALPRYSVRRQGRYPTRQTFGYTYLGPSTARTGLEHKPGPTSTFFAELTTAYEEMILQISDRYGPYRVLYVCIRWSDGARRIEETRTGENTQEGIS